MSNSTRAINSLPPGWGENEQPVVETKLPLAAQLFTVADMMSKDLRGTLKLVKEAGYDGVEFARAEVTAQGNPLCP